METMMALNERSGGTVVEVIMANQARGMPCKTHGCKGRIVVDSTVELGNGTSVRYVGCPVCRWRPRRNKIVGPTMARLKRKRGTA